MSEHEVFMVLLARREELTPDELAMLRDHLAACPSCRSLSMAYDDQDDVIRSQPLARPPVSYRRRVRARLDGPASTRHFPWR